MFPFLSELKERMGVGQMRDDIMAGLTLAFLAIPQCMAYAVIANLQPIYGLYAGIVTAIVASLFMTSRHVVTGPTATVSVIVAGVLYGIDLPMVTAVFILSLLVGVFQLALFLLGLGNLARFVSDAVITGFVMGSAVVIIGGQLLSLLGAPSVQSSYFVVRVYYGVRSLLQNPALFNQTALIFGAFAVGVMVILRLLHERLPASLLVMVGAAVVVWLRPGLAVETIGSIPTAFPAPVIPSDLSFSAAEQLASGALALSLFCSVQCVSIGKSIASLSGQRIDANREIASQGFANIAAGLFQGYPVAASFSRSFLNQNVGGRTQLSTMFCGVFIAVLTALGAPLLFYVPLSVLAGIIIVVVADVIEVEELSTVWTTTTRDRWAFTATFVGVLVLKLDIAVYLGVAASLVLHLRRTTQLDLKEYIIDQGGNLKHITSADERIECDVAVIDVNGEAFFGSADQIKKRVRDLCSESDQLKVIILRMKNAANIDITGATVLRDIAEQLRSDDRTLMLCGTTPHIRDVLRQAGVARIIGEGKIMVAQKNLLESTKSALERAQNHISDVLDGDVGRGEEDPDLEHTMEDLAEDIEQEDDQEPIEQEKHTAHNDERTDEEDGA